MNKTHTDQWLLYLVRGIFAVLFGVMTIIMPAEAFMGLVIFLAAFMIADGILTIVFSSHVKSGRTLRRVLLVTVSGAVALALTFFNPFIAVLLLLALFAIWSFFSGLKEMLEAVSSRGRNGEGWYIISGLLCVLIALLIFVNPLAGTVTLALVFGSYALVTGCILVLLAFKLRHKTRHHARKRYHGRLTHS